MLQKSVEIPEIGAVTLVKHPRARSLRITLLPQGKVRITLPRWLPFGAGVEFAKSRADWIEAHRTQVVCINDGAAVGKAHHIFFRQTPDVVAPKKTVKNNQITIFHPLDLTSTDPSVQALARKVAISILREQSNTLLPPRLQNLAKKHALSYKSVHIRQLKARWGSCTNQADITLNLFLIQLPWDLIDYVLLHELTHTRHMHHGKDFWDAFEQILPNAKKLRKAIRTYSPSI